MSLRWRKSRRLWSFPTTQTLHQTKKSRERRRIVPSTIKLERWIKTGAGGPAFRWRGESGDRRDVPHFSRLHGRVANFSREV
jgi:hypothetical protein